MRILDKNSRGAFSPEVFPEHFNIIACIKIQVKKRKRVSICRHFYAEFQESVRILNKNSRGAKSPEVFTEHFNAYIIYDFRKIIKRFNSLKIPHPLKERRQERRFLTNRI